MEPETTRRRVSKFDVAPEQMTTPNLITSFLSSPSSSTLQFGPNGIYNAPSEFYGEYDSVIDPLFTLRLEKALERNYEYVKRLDNQAEVKVTSNANYHHMMKQHALLSAASVSAAAGIGAAKLIAQMNNQLAKQQQESVSVYVSGLPLDITEEELEILFGTVSVVSSGPKVKRPPKMLKKIRIYSDPTTGKKKGDALLTFTKPEFAKTAVTKYNEMDIGDGCVIKVTRADFQQNNTNNNSKGSGLGQADEEEDDTDWDDSNRPTLSDSLPLTELKKRSLSEIQHSNSQPTSTPMVDRATLLNVLPSECMASTHPVLVILNLYTNESLATLIANTTTGSIEDAVTKYYEDLEADLLVDCCHFGRVRFIQTLDLTEDIMNHTGGCVAVTFDDITAAEECAKLFNKRKIEGKPVSTVVFTPDTALMSEVPQYTPLDKLPPNIPPPPPPPGVKMPVNFVKAETNTIVNSVVTATTNSDVNIEDVKQVESNEPSTTVVIASGEDDLDVDSFLNSFL